MAPSDFSGFNVCPFASIGCIKGWLNTAGMVILSHVQVVRISKTKFWGYDRIYFYVQLGNELIKIHEKKIDKCIKIAIRLNVTSDIDHLDLLRRYAGIDFLETFYDN